MTLDELESELSVMVRAFRVNYKLDRLISTISIQFVVHQFGTVITGLLGSEYKLVSDVVNQAYPDHRKVYIAHNDSLLEKKDEVLWALMRGGYIAWLRTEYPRDFKNFVTFQEFGKKIINKRLDVWAGKARYKYLIDYNTMMLNQPATYVLSIDPSFYDYMPE
jgi:hypothetical protein